MNVTCSDCRSVFRVDPAKVPLGGVRARCSVCGGVIVVTAPDFVASLSRASVAATAMAAAPVVEAPARESEPEAGFESDAAAAPELAMDEPVAEVEAPAPPAARATPPTPPAAVMPVVRQTSPTITPPRAPFSPPVRPTFTPPAAPASSTPAPPAFAPPALPAPRTTQSRTMPPFTAPVVPGFHASAASAASAASVAPSTPSTPVDGTPHRVINPFLNNDPNQKAKRLARALVSDMVAYLPQKREQGLNSGTLKTLFREEIMKSYEEYVDQVGQEFADTTTYFQDALNEILAGGKRVF